MIKISGFGILCYDTRNIGDEIQSIAASQYLPSVDFYILRDDMSIVYDKNWQRVDERRLTKMKIAVLINGWFMHPRQGQYQFPPKNCQWMIPLFTSIHLDVKESPKLLTPEAVRYLRDFQPIGCRDSHTQKLLTIKGVDTYLSGCLTLGLRSGLKGGSIGKIYSVRKHPKGTRNFSHDHKLDPATIGARFEHARKLISVYARASEVVTDRLHCYLPCIALRVPVKYVGKIDARTQDYITNPGLKFRANNEDVKRRISEFVNGFEVSAMD